MMLSCLLPLELLAAANATHFALIMTTEQTEELIVRLSDALDEVYEMEDASPLARFNPSNN